MRTTHTDKPRRYIGESRAWYLVKWLNEPRTPEEWKEWSQGTGRIPREEGKAAYFKATARVSLILDCFQELYGLAKLLNWHQDPSRERGLWDRYRALGQTIDQGLERYKFRPSVNLNKVTKQDGVWQPYESSGMPFNIARAISGVAPDECAAILRIDEGHSKGWLKRVKRCRVCCRWFFARVIDSPHCGRKCRNKERQATPEYKLWRHNYYLQYEKRRRIAKAGKQK
jgi:hypothetical protein